MKKHYGKKILQMVKQLDIFSTQVALNVKEQETYHSLIGAVVSAGIYIFTYFSFISMAIQLYARQSPNIVNKIEYTPHPEVLKNYFILKEFFFTSEDFQFQFIVTNDQGLPVFNLPNATIYTSKFQNCYLVNQITPTGQTTKIESCFDIPILPCGNSGIPEQLKQKFQLPEDQFKILNCPEYISFSKKKLSLGDTQASNNFSYIRIQLFKCINNTLNPYICSPPEIIEQNLRTGYMGINYFDRLLDQQQQGNPYVTINKFNYFTISSSNYHKKVFIYLRHSIMETLENFWYYLETTFANHVLQYEYKEEFNDPAIDNINGEFFRIGFFLDDKLIHYYRNYDNILNIIGSISGTHGIICFFFSLFITPLNQLLLNREMIDSLFNFEQLIDKNKQRKIKPYQVNQLKNLSQLTQKDKKLSKAKELRDLIERRDSRLSLKITEVFCNRYKRLQIQESVQKIIQKMDIVIIIQKLIEFDKLKRLLLDENQLKLFDYIPKPLVPIHIPDQLEESKTEHVGIDYFQREKSFNIKIIEALIAYKGLCKKQKLDPLDERLISMINEDMKDLFDKYIQTIQWRMIRKIEASEVIYRMINDRISKF